MIEYNDFDQGSAEWLQFRIGKIGGSNCKDVFKANNLDLIDNIIAEIGSNLTDSTFVTYDMQRGKDLEPTVRRYFTAIHGIEVEEIAICQSDKYEWLTCSPDGFSKDRKIGIEIKCSKTKKHVQYIRMGVLPTEYKHQVFNYFLVNQKLETMYFISFDDRYKPKPYFEVKIDREDILNELEEMEAELVKFWAKLEKYKKIVEL
jgi:putative phage-type endonuclease